MVSTRGEHERFPAKGNNVTPEDRSRLLHIAEYMQCGGMDAEDPRITPAAGAIMFCREDPRMAAATAVLCHRGLIGYCIVSGGIGKDSGMLPVLGRTEAEHQRRLLVHEHRVSVPIYCEPLATNGAENSRFALARIRALELPHRRMVLIMPPRCARRLFAVHTYISRTEYGDLASEHHQIVTMDDPFDLDNPVHRSELLREFIRVSEWPDKGWSDAQPNFPSDLSAWAKTIAPA